MDGAGWGINYAWTTYEEAQKYDLVEGLIEEIKMVDDLKNVEGHIDNQAI